MKLKYTRCGCTKHKHNSKRIVLTGGPGAGKTAVLEMVRHLLCPHITILPESASILFGGGFWRKPDLAARKAAQRAIYYIQREQEQMVQEEANNAVTLCDRGTIDGLAYWPLKPHLFFKQVKSSRPIELERYDVVIHLRTPAFNRGYDLSNPVRIESAEEAIAIDLLIEEAWRGHPHRHFVSSTETFLEKAQKTLELIETELPRCCENSLS
jgi:predicted ATPase